MKDLIARLRSHHPGLATPWEAADALETLADLVASLRTQVDQLIVEKDDARRVCGNLFDRLMSVTSQLEAAYAELRKQRPAIGAVFDRDVWDRAQGRRP